MLKKKLCKAITTKGKKCEWDAVLGDYCVTHYKMKKDEIRRKKNNDKQRRSN